LLAAKGVKELKEPMLCPNCSKLGLFSLQVCDFTCNLMYQVKRKTVSLNKQTEQENEECCESCIPPKCNIVKCTGLQWFVEEHGLIKSWIDER
jgi:hypothetical protein